MAVEINHDTRKETDLVLDRIFDEWDWLHGVDDHPFKEMRTLATKQRELLDSLAEAHEENEAYVHMREQLTVISQKLRRMRKAVLETYTL